MSNSKTIPDPIIYDKQQINTNLNDNLTMLPNKKLTTQIDKQINVQQKQPRQHNFSSENPKMMNMNKNAREDDKPNIVSNQSKLNNVPNNQREHLSYSTLASQPVRQNKGTRKTDNVRLGFTETLKNRKEPKSTQQIKSMKICEDIFTNGSKVTKKNYYPSEFPKLTKLKPVIITMKKGGRKRNKL
jgi:hypothetical protein